jgi:predicted enzyme related to lactoylglutathione lyase
MRYPEGQFSWTDLGTPDPEQARTFYGGLFGWESKDVRAPTGPPFTMFLLHGQVVAGLRPQPPQLRDTGVAPAWTSYINVENLEHTIRHAVEAGGTVAMGPMGVTPEGRMAMIADPSGAVVGLWSPEEHQGVDLLDAPGALSWHELQTRDLDRATRFYATVFGWQWASSGDTEYLLATIESKDGPGKSVAGAMSMPPAVPPHVPSYWSVYFGVADCDASTWLATELGGETFLAPMSISDMRFSGITDPSGARFMLLSDAHSRS